MQIKATLPMRAATYSYPYGRYQKHLELFTMVGNGSQRGKWKIRAMYPKQTSSRIDLGIGIFTYHSLWWWLELAWVMIAGAVYGFSMIILITLWQSSVAIEHRHIQ